MQDIIEKIVKELEKAQATVAVAESCTGGMVSASLVDYPGVSACFIPMRQKRKISVSYIRL